MGPSGQNVVMIFSGSVDVSNALQDSANIAGKYHVFAAPVADYLCVGGGNKNGYWTATALSEVTAAIQANPRVTGYVGLCFDVELGDSGLESGFAQSFAAAKAAGLQVFVTISHSQPYAIADAASLMQSFLNDGNIDYISPILYSSGSESSNDYTFIGTPWSAFANSKAAVVPSIVCESYYASAVEYFSSHGVTLHGYVAWSQSPC